MDTIPGVSAISLRPGFRRGHRPDALFHKGQNWGFPPLHPQKMREQGYRYPIAYLNHHMKYADILRVDHVMGLHRLFWVPQGMEATEGVYVRYPSDEMYAILSVESHKHRCLVVGRTWGPCRRTSMTRWRGTMSMASTSPSTRCRRIRTQG